MDNNILNEETSRMRFLFGYQKGVVISEQSRPNQTTTTTTTAAASTTTTTTSNQSITNDDSQNWSDVVKYYSGNTDTDWEFVKVDTYENDGVIYDYLKVKTKNPNNMGADCKMNLYDDNDAYLVKCKKSKSVRGTWSWDGSKPKMSWDRNITKSASGYVSDDDTEFSAMTSSNEIMGVGATGVLVKKVQNYLAANGYTGETFTNDIQGCATDESKCDGIYGTKTKDMVKKFQEDAGIKVDGIFGQQTYEAMFE